MDALELLKERRRMCIYYGHCEGCPLERVSCAFEQTDSDEEYETVIAAVEKWSKEHPRKTRQSVFLDQYPEAKIENDGCLSVCPSLISATYRSNYGHCVIPNKSCYDCCREFWGQEVE